MADFRRWIYALAPVALLAGFTVPVSAQAPPLECIANAGVPPTIRAEGWTELLGDLTLNCSGGTPTPAGQVVQPVNITVQINAYLTSRSLSGNYLEALLIIDEPHSATNPTRPILACGGVGAADSGPSGHDVCAIIATPDPSHTYDGTTSTYGGSCAGTPVPGFTCAAAGAGAFTSGSCPSTITNATTAAGYSCGRPNVFQGQAALSLVAGQTNVVTWLGVPLDPPGTTTNRTLRITNLRADAHDAAGLATSGTFTATYIQASISINGNTSLSVNNPQQIIAFIGPGLAPSPATGIITTNNSFLQCIGEPQAPPVYNGSQVNGGTPSFQFTEGFASSWKAKNIAMILNGGNGIAPGATNAYWAYDGFNTTTGTINYPADLNQNVPGAIYNTESGFEYPATTSTSTTALYADPNPNPPPGVGTVPVTATTQAMGNATNIQNAGEADSGTRLQVLVSNIPTGVLVYVPDAIYLHNCVGTSTACQSGIAVLTKTTNTVDNGDGAYSPYWTKNTSAASAAAAYTVINAGNAVSGTATYEILFSDPFSVETLLVPTLVTYTPSLAMNQPIPAQYATATGGFAPNSSAATARTASTGPIPRFVPGTVPSNANYFIINRCACNLLFPFVTNVGGYDTGIAIANTSMDNLANGGSAANPQFGGVQFWFYGTGPNGGTAPGTQCTNVANPGVCPTPLATSTSSAIGQVPAGSVLTYVLSSSGGAIGTGANGLAPNWAAGFQGYVIAQAQFQYCHGYAFVTAQSGGPLSPAISEGYLGLILDNSGLAAGANCSTTNLICRTNQKAELLVH